MDDMQLYTAASGKPVMSQYTAVKRFQDLDDNSTDVEIATMNAENAAMFMPNDRPDQ